MSTRRMVPQRLERPPSVHSTTFAVVLIGATIARSHVVATVLPDSLLFSAVPPSAYADEAGSFGPGKYGSPSIAGVRAYSTVTDTEMDAMIASEKAEFARLFGRAPPGSAVSAEPLSPEVSATVVSDAKMFELSTPSRASLGAMNTGYFGNLRLFAQQPAAEAAQPTASATPSLPPSSSPQAFSYAAQNPLPLLVGVPLGSRGIGYDGMGGSASAELSGRQNWVRADTLHDDRRTAAPDAAVSPTKIVAAPPIATRLALFGTANGVVGKEGATLLQVDEHRCSPACQAGRGVCATRIPGGSPQCVCQSPYTSSTCSEIIEGVTALVPAGDTMAARLWLAARLHYPAFASQQNVASFVAHGLFIVLILAACWYFGGLVASVLVKRPARPVPARGRMWEQRSRDGVVMRGFPEAQDEESGDMTYGAVSRDSPWNEPDKGHAPHVQRVHCLGSSRLDPVRVPQVIKDDSEEENEE